MELKIDFDTVIDVIGTGSAAYVGYALTGGSPIPGFAQLVPFVAALALGIVTWRVARENNK